jgi:nucleoside phosphorylase
LEKFKTVVTKSEMDSLGNGPTILATYDGYKKWSPRGIIMVGIAYGKRKNIAKIVKAEKAKGMIRR